MTHREREQACSRALLACARGDTDALRDLYDIMARLIFATARSVTGNYQDAEDVLQDTFLEIVRYAGSYQKGAKAVAWILAITRHLSIDLLRRRQRAVPMEHPPEPAPTPHPAFDRLEILELLDHLEEDERQLILYRLYGGLSYREISAITELSVAAAQKRYQRAIGKLKKMTSK